jgi:hypothetical protein
VRPNNVIDGSGGFTPTESATGKAEALALGITETILTAFPELKPIFDMFIAGNIAEARLAYFNSEYYRMQTGTSAQRKTTKATRPGVYAQELDAWKQAQKRRLTEKGFIITPDMEALLESSYDSGDTDVQLEIRILNSGKLGSKIGGSTLGTVNALKAYADDQGVGYILPKNYWDKVSSGLLSGTITDESIQEELKGFAISAYPAYAKGIEAGRSFGMQTSAARQMIANLLEKDVDTITNDNPLFQKVTGYVNPKTGSFEVMPLWEVQQVVKNSDEWLYTNNARDAFDSVGRNVLQQFRLAF